jgi:hypothetical protein
MIAGFLTGLAGVLSPVCAQDASSKKFSLKKLAENAGSSEPATVVGVRGLDKSSTETDTHARDYKAVDRMEAVKVSAQDLDAFAKEGKLK